MHQLKLQPDLIILVNMVGVQVQQWFIATSLHGAINDDGWLHSVGGVDLAAHIIPVTNTLRLQYFR